MRDANEQALAFVYCEDEPGRRSAASAPTAPWCRCTRTRCEALRRHCRTPEAAFASVGVVRPQLKPDRFPDEFLCLTPAILLSYPTEWLRDGSGPSPLNRWEIRKANESQMQSMVSDICISGLWSHAARRSSSMPEVSALSPAGDCRSSASVRELLN